MEKENKDLYNKPSPLTKAGLFSKLTFSWTFPTFWKGYKQDLDPGDLFSPLDEHRSNQLGDAIQQAWNEEEASAGERKRTASLLRVLTRMFGGEILSLTSALCLMEVVKMMQPLFLGGLIDYFREGSEVTQRAALLNALGILFCCATNIAVIHPYMMAVMHVGMKIRISCSSLVYRKALRLSKTALGAATMGQVVNLISNDAGRFDGSVLFSPYLIIGPLQTIAVTYFLWGQIGVASVIGVASLLTFIPIQLWLGKMTSNIRLRTAARTDKRVRLMNEIISGIQVIKMYGWEQPFAQLVSEARRAELKEITKYSYIRGLLSSFTIFQMRIAIFISVLSYVFGGNFINATKVFVVTSYFNVLQHALTVYMPKAITLGAEALISVRRFQDFLLSGEVKLQPESLSNGCLQGDGKGVVNHVFEPDTPASPQYALALSGVTARWTPGQQDDTLHHLSLNVPPGQLVAVIGPVGCGKTSLLHAMLGELPLQSGSLRLVGQTSYSSQEPWLFAGSVRQNILFGAPYNKKRYRQVVEACALWHDFKHLFSGDKTIVGERGVSLSGGQKARINLARAVYKQADIYLLDDPLSAVDPRVSKHLFQQCIMGLLKHKTVVLVTHQLQYLESVHKIVLMQAGSIVAEGSFQQLQASGQQFTKLLLSSIAEDARHASTPDDPKHTRSRLMSHISTTSSVEGCDSEDKSSMEDYAAGGIRSFVFTEYFSAAGHKCIVVLMLGLCIITQVFANGGDYWITHWVNLEEYVYPKYEISNSTTNTTQYNISYFNRETCIVVFSALTCTTFFVTLLRSYVFFNMCMRASFTLHSQMFRSVTRATMNFFQTTLSGRILNRFSKDISNVDENLPNCLMECIQRGLTLLSVIIMVSVVNPWVLAPTFVITYMLYFLRKMYLSTSQAVKRLESIARSPMFSHLSSSLRGLTTIRAFQAESMLTQEFDYHQDMHSSAWYLFLSSSRAFGFWLDLVCLLYISVVVLSFVVLDLKVHGGLVGLSITQSMSLTGMLQLGMRQSAELENIMTSVQRVLEYAHLESEPRLQPAPDDPVPEKWPSGGTIEFRKVSMRYSDHLPRVLKDITFLIMPKEKIGIVGRTGAGKSSLLAALLRLHDIEGDILIDEVDTEVVGLQALRTNISIIPQEPVLFSGTLRMNLDPFNKYTDEQLWNALQEVELKEVVSELGLEWQLAEGGTNFSVGQRQLVCLARAILRRNHILVLDEATANVDPQTDALIQNAIRNKFADCTVLTIAHRLHTIMDSDRLMVLDSGVLVEFDHPWTLLQNKNGFLSRMVRESGRGAAEVLHMIAAQNYQKRSKSEEQIVTEELKLTPTNTN